MILKSETYHFHRLDLTRQAGFIVTVYDEDGLRLGATPPLPTPDEALTRRRRIGHGVGHITDRPPAPSRCSNIMS